MSFRIPKSSFFFHIIRLYCRLCSTFILLLFFIMALEKWILFLNYFFYRVNDYSMRFPSSATSLFSPIQWKADSKLLKKQLLDDFWWYCISSASGRNCNVLVILELPIGTPNILYFCVLSPLNLAWYNLFIEIWLMCHEFSFNHSWSRSNQCFFLSDCTWNVIYFCLIFLFFII